MLSRSRSDAACTDCELDSFQPLAGQTNCSACSNASSSLGGALYGLGGAVTAAAATVNSSQCRACPPGSYHRSAGRCEPCALGKWQSRPASLGCEQCAAGWSTVGRRGAVHNATWRACNFSGEAAHEFGEVKTTLLLVSFCVCFCSCRCSCYHRCRCSC